MNRIRFPEALPLSQVRDRVVEQIRHEKGKDLAVVKAYEALPKAAAAKSVKATAAAFGVPVVETGWVGAEGAPGVPAALVQDALLLPSGEVAPVKTVGDAHYLFQVTAKEDSRVPPLSEVRDKVVAEVAREKKAAAARAALQQVLAASNTAAELEANAKKAGLSSSLTAWFAPLSEPVPEALAGAGRPPERPLRPLRESAGLPKGVPGAGRESPRRGVFRRATSLRRGVGGRRRPAS